MRRMKGDAAGVPVSFSIQRIFLIVIGLFFIIIIVQWASATEAAMKVIEEATITYTITSSVNGFSVAEKARMIVEFKTIYDIEIECKEECNIKVTPYNGGKKGKTSDDFKIIGNILQKSVKLTKVDKVCIEKGYEDPKDKVVIKKC